MSDGSPEPTAGGSGRARRGRGLGAAALVAAAATALLGVRIATGFDGFFLDDDVLNQRWVLEHRDAPWAALTERHALHDHIRPLNLGAHWLGATIADGAWWGPHAVLVALFVLSVGGAAALARALALRERAGLAAASAALLVAGLPAGGKLLGWNAWMGSAGELACGLWAVALAVAGLGREGRGRVLGFTGAALLVVAAGLFKEPGWIVYPLAIVAAAMTTPGVRSSTRVGVVVGFGLLGAAGLAFVWHPANAGHYAASGTPLAERASDALAMFFRSTASTWPVGEGGGMTVPVLVAAVGGAIALRLAPREAARVVAVPAALVLAGVGVMLPNPDLHPVHLLPAAAGVAVLVAIGLGGLPARGILGGFALLGVLAWQLAGTAPSIAASPPLRAEEVLRTRLLGLAALVRAVHAQAVAVPPGGDDAAGEGAYVREATRFLVPYLGAPAEGEGAGGRSRRGGEGMPLFTEGAVLRVPPAAERWAMDHNVLAQLGARLENGPPVASAAPAGTYAIGAVHRGGAGTDAAMVATDGCGARWEAPATSDERRMALLPVLLDAGCLPLSLGVDKAITTEVFFLLVPLDPPRLSLWDAPTDGLPVLLDVGSRVATPTPLPAFDPPPSGR